MTKKGEPGISNSSEPLTISCSHEKLMIIPQTVQLIPCRQEDKASQLQTDTTQNSPRR